MRRLLLSILLCMVLLYSSIVPVVASETATLTIEPDKTQIIADGGETKITYTITVTPPEGKEIGVFSFRLKPSGDMVLPQSFKDGAGETVIRYAANDLPYNVTSEEGVFRTYEYTPQSNFFAAVGSVEGNRMKSEAQILTITATIPAGSSGVYAMDADFTVAPDGSGEAYIGRVVSPPVAVMDPDGKLPADGGDGAKTPVVFEEMAGQSEDLPAVVAAEEQPQIFTAEITADDEMPKATAPAMAAAPAASARAAQTDGADPRTVALIMGGLFASAGAVLVLWKRKRQ